MNALRCASILLAITCGLVAGHHGHHHDGDGYGSLGVHAKEVGYAVETSHGHNYGHGGGHHSDHESVHEWSSTEGHDAGHYDGFAAEHYGGHDGGHFGGHGHGDDDGGHDHHAYPKYDFSYGVKDSKSGDIKSHSESRDGGSVKGSYSLKEADGTTRHVEYTADKHKGFNAVVHTTGTANAGHSGGHDAGHYDHGHGHGHASSYTIVNKQEEKKH